MQPKSSSDESMGLKIPIKLDPIADCMIPVPSRGSISYLANDTKTKITWDECKNEK